MPEGSFGRSLSPFGRLVPHYRREILEALKGSVWGHPMEYHDRIDSTNERAKAWARKGAPQGALVIADHQTEGKGRLGRRWIAAPATSVLASVVLRPTLTPALASLLTLSWAVAMRDALSQEAGHELSIKWPNDLVFEERKVSGILTESILSASGIEAAVVGFGVNVNQETFESQKATSLSLIAGRTLKRGPLVARILKEAHRRIGELESGGPEETLNLCRRHSVTIGREVTLFLPEHEVVGKAVDIDADGRLVLETASGLFRASAGEVSTREGMA